MPVASKSLGVILNAALKELGEPEITAIDTTDILQERLIEVANNAVRYLVDYLPYQWRLQRTTLSTNADITTESAAVTNASTTVNSVTSAGVAADNWGSVTTSMWFRAAATQKSYQISAVSTGASPDTITLETAYLNTTSTAIGYRIFQDTYSVSTANFGSLIEASYGDASSWAGALGGGIADSRLLVTPFDRLMYFAAGDRHRDTSGRPRVISQIGVDSSNNPQFVLWPFPGDAYLIELWYAVEFTENATFATVMFGNDAPGSAYDYVEHKVVAAAHLWDENTTKATFFEQLAQNTLANIVRREHRERGDVSMEVETYRRHYGGGYRVRSGILFDTVSRRH